jgi:tRNA-specific 2-thiouridylase
MAKPRVVVGMSGGVDSSFTAYLLQEQGYDVIGVMLTLWTEPSREGENRCCSIDSQTIARQTAYKLGIPFYAVDARDLFRSIVVEEFIQGYSAGITPNPCVLCNASVRWQMLLESASMFSADFVATGHYAQITRDDNGEVHLLRGRDRSKDQSYVLSMVKSEYLQRTLLPLGAMTKEDVRAKSKAVGLPNASRPDSQDLCFLGGMDYREFITKYADTVSRPGDIVDEDGAVVGQHEGLAYYTLGQRKGLRIASEAPYFVLSKETTANRLIVSHSPQPDVESFKVSKVNWITPPEKQTFTADVQVRYKSTSFPAEMKINGESILVQPAYAQAVNATPGQVAVFNNNDECLGGGIIV